MTMFKNRLVLLTILLTTILFISCTSTITKRKDPIFSVEESIIQSDLNKIVTCERINLAGKEITTNGKASSELEVSIINGKDIPSDDTQMTVLGKSIAGDIKKSLKDQEEYDKIIVLFVTQSTEGEVTKRNWKGHEFKSEEL